jgi:hypothetical protein
MGAGVLTTVACLRPDQKLRIFGFNWNKGNWFMHKMDAEQKIIRRLLAGRQVEINPTACDGMYTCDKLCDGLFYRLAKDGDKSVCEQRVRPVPWACVCLLVQSLAKLFLTGGSILPDHRAIPYITLLYAYAKQPKPNNTYISASHCRYIYLIAFDSLDCCSTWSERCLPILSESSHS